MQAEKNNERMFNELEWYNTLEILLAKTNARYTLSIRNNQLVIHSDKTGIDIISNRLITALGSTENFRYFLPYQVSNRPKPKATIPVDRAKFKVPRPQDTVETGLRIFNAVFKKALDKLRFNGFFGEDSTVKDGVLWSEPVEDFLKTIWQLALKTALGSFSDTTFDAIRDAMYGDNSRLSVPSRLVPDHVVADGFLQECLGYVDDFDDDNHPRTRIFFNFGRLFDLTHPPDIEPVEVKADIDDNNYELCIDINRLTTFLSVLVQGVLLKVHKDEEAAIHANPIFITSKNMVVLQNLYLLFLDRSGSMENDLPRVKKELISYIDGLRKTDPHSRVRIVPFSDVKHPAKDFPITDEKQINDFIFAIPSQGETHLFRTLDQELSYLQSITGHCNIKMIIFTDGQDTSKMPWSSFEKPIADKIKTLNEDGTLQIIPIGAGTVDEGPLCAMAKTCGSAFRRLKDGSSLDGIFKEVSISQPVMKLVDFVIKLQQCTEQFTVAVPQTGLPFMPHISFALSPNQQYTIKTGQDSELIISVPSTDEIQAQSLGDQLHQIKIRAATIAADDSKSTTLRILELHKVLSELASLKTTQRYEVVLVANVKDDIQTQLVNSLKNVEYNPEQAAAAISRFGAITGVTQHLTNMASHSSASSMNNN